MRMACAPLCVILCCAITAPALAYRIDQVDVEHDGARYRVHMRAELNVPAARTYAVFADTRLLPEINPAVTEASLINSADAMPRLRTRVRLCVGLLCKSVKQVQDMYYFPSGNGGRIEAKVIPQVSDFRFGQARWEFLDCNGNTCLQFDATVEPDFWVPPLIGPWLIRRAMLAEAEHTCEGLERLSHEGTG